MVSYAQGFNSYVGIGVQGSALTTNVASTAFQTFNSETLKENKPSFQKVIGLKNTRDYTLVQRGRRNVSGAINYPLIPDEAGTGLLIAMLMGNNNTVATTDTSAYTHTFSQMREATTADKPAYGATLDILRGSVDNTLLMAYAGCFLNKWTLGVKGDGGIVECSADFVGAKEILTAPTIDTPTYSTKKPFEGWQATLKLGSSIGSVSTISNVQDINVSINNNLKMLPSQNGSQYPVACQYGPFDVMMDFSMNLMESRTIYDYFTGQTEIAAQLILTSDQLAGAATAYYSLQIDLPRVIVVGDVPNVSGPNEIPHKVQIQAVKQPTSTVYTTKITVVNTQSGTYAV